MSKSKYNPNELLKFYRAHNPNKPFTIEEAYEWLKAKGHDLSEEFDPKEHAIRKLKRAAKNSSWIDPQGRKMPEFINISEGSGEDAVFHEMKLTPPPVMQRALNNLKDKGVQVLIQAQTIADSYNDNINKGPNVQLELEFIVDEVREGALMRKRENDGLDAT